MGADDALRRIRTSLEAAKARTRRFRRMHVCGAAAIPSLLALELAASGKRHSPEQIDDEYQRVVGEYPELFA
jgi:hypothetical protein